MIRGTKDGGRNRGLAKNRHGGGGGKRKGFTHAERRPTKKRSSSKERAKLKGLGEAGLRSPWHGGGCDLKKRVTWTKRTYPRECKKVPVVLEIWGEYTVDRDDERERVEGSQKSSFKLQRAWKNTGDFAY